MNKVFLIILIIIGKTSQQQPTADDEKEWINFKLKYKKSYQSPNEEQSRRNIFIEKLHTILDHNKLYDNGSVSWKMSVNSFADLTPQELSQSLLGSSASSPQKRTFWWWWYFNPSSSCKGKTPPTLDWRESGIVTAVKNQGSCGSCWAFAAVGTVEAHLNLKTSSHLVLSDQNVLDCSSFFYGCNGGTSTTAYDYIQKKGITVEANYPYTMTKNKCKKTTDVYRINGYTTVRSNRENDMKIALACKGPLAVSLHANRIFQYSGGIYKDPWCSRNTNHMVIAVGYGTESGKDYWLVKNSWGDEWGENGYIKIARNVNQCGISNSVYFPNV